MMPRNLVFVRHGESDGNIAVERSKVGDYSHYTDDFVNIPGSQWRLSPKGIEQAQTTGTWLKDIYTQFHRQIVSPYVRTKETAGHLGMGGNWMMNRAVRERDWGDIGSVLRKDFKTEYPRNFTMKSIDPLYWRPPGGESIVDVSENRVRNLLDTLHRECEGDDVLVVSHGEFMWASRLVLERWSDTEFINRDSDKNEKIHNAQAICYTRVNPHTNELAKRLEWVRVATPVIDDSGVWSMNVSKWQKFGRELLTDEMLLEEVNQIPHSISYD